MIRHNKIIKHSIFLLIFVSFFIVVPWAGADTVGQVTTFFVNKDFDKYARNQINATLRYTSERAYFYVEDSYWNKLGSYQQSALINNISSLAIEFDNNIYPKETGLWGSEPNPGIDGDPKITILLEELVQNNGGYFDTSNGYSREQNPGSNQREMVVINVEVTASNPVISKIFLAHEFQHIISFNQKDLIHEFSEDVWLNEIRSEYSISLVGYNDNYSGSNLERRAESFLENPYDSLTEWPNKNSDYGIAALFGEYLVEQFGEAILSETIGNPLAGISSLDWYFQNKGRQERFSDIFLNWMSAVYMNNFSLDKKLGYQRPGLKNINVSPRQKAFLSDFLSEYSIVQTIKDWQPVWIEFDFDGDNSKSIQLELSGASGDRFFTSYLAFFNSGAVQVGRFSFINNRAVATVLNSAEGLNRVTVLATKGTKTSGFASNEQAGTLSIKASVVETKKAEASIIKDGSLIKKRGEKEIYVVWGKYKRYLALGAISLYGHLNPADAIEVEPEIFHSYTTSNYVKYLNDEKVYAVWPDEGKHWLNITPQQWDVSGRDWGAIFVINDLELNYYKTGADIMK